MRRAETLAPAPALAAGPLAAAGPRTDWATLGKLMPYLWAYKGRVRGQGSRRGA